MSNYRTSWNFSHTNSVQQPSCLLGHAHYLCSRWKTDPGWWKPNPVLKNIFSMDMDTVVDALFCNERWYLLLPYLRVKTVCWIILKRDSWEWIIYVTETSVKSQNLKWIWIKMWLQRMCEDAILDNWNHKCFEEKNHLLFFSSFSCQLRSTHWFNEVIAVVATLT